MSVINAADQIMAIFGFKRVRCESCYYSEGVSSTQMKCNSLSIIVRRDDQCEKYVREPGAEGDE